MTNSHQLRWLWVAVLAIASPTWGGATFEQRASSLAGLWFTTEAGDGKHRVFHVTNVKRVDSASAELVAYYGFAQGSWKEPEEMVVRLAGERIRIEFRTQSGRRAQLFLDPDDRIRGALSKDGTRPIALAFARKSLASVHQWIAENPSARTRAHKGSSIELVYVSAPDCPGCMGWEAVYTEGHGRLKGALGWADVRFTEIGLGSYRGAAGVRDFPERLRPAVAQWFRASGRSSINGTPWFVLLVNGERRCSAFGSGYFESLIKPCLTAALAEKAADATGK